MVVLTEQSGSYFLKYISGHKESHGSKYLSQTLTITITNTGHMSTLLSPKISFTISNKKSAQTLINYIHCFHYHWLANLPQLVLLLLQVQHISPPQTKSIRVTNWVKYLPTGEKTPRTQSCSGIQAYPILKNVFHLPLLK